jgi:feruloyl esterase
MTKNLGYYLLACAAVAAAPAYAAPTPAACRAMTGFSAPNTSVASAIWQRAGTVTARSGVGAPVTLSLPAHCVIEGVADAYREANRDYGVKFELRLPADWNGRFLFQGGGGLDGSVLPAYGSNVGGTTALSRGFAVVSMDGGHEGPDASFGSSQQARLDYAYQAVGKATAVAKAAIAHFYAKMPRYSYFEGCSNGGREAMMAAERYPLEFDGIVAGDPGFQLAHAAVGEAWNNQHYAAIAPKDAQGHPDLANALSDADLKLVTDSLLAQCDKLDGLADGMINNTAACHFTPQKLLCAPGQSAACLSQPKIDALLAINRGARDSKGNALYSGFPYDAGMSSIGWRAWMLGIPGKMKSLNEMLGGQSLALYFLTPQQPNLSPYALDFDKAAENIASTAAINDPDGLMFSSFTSHGGKLLIYQGGSDPVFSPAGIEDWYQRLEAATPATSDFARLFLVPGMNHCGGGPATDQFDPLTVVQKWVEGHQAPQRIIATSSSIPGISRPLCSYPKYAQYKAGDANQAASFMCVAPKNAP